MTDIPETRRVIISNPEGLHLRAAGLLAELAKQFRCSIHVVRGTNQRADGKSVLDLTTLGAEQGTELTLEARGDDAGAALDALEKLIQSHFAARQQGQA